MNGRPQKYKNRLSKREALAKLDAETQPRTTLSFYKYVWIDRDMLDFRDELFRLWEQYGVLGRIYISPEGINAQMSLPTRNMEDFRIHLSSYPEFTDIPFKIAVEDDGKSFWKLMIKVRTQIVADGLKPKEYDVTNVGQHVNAEEFHALLEQEDTIVVDMRNQYESDIGHFQNAICPKADTFREELPLVKKILSGKQQKNIALYCTGGIRCEKASAYLKHNGFSRVYQLHGGIIDYAHQIQQKGLSSRFLGKNFVFDNRGAEAITDDVLTTCHSCGTSCDTYVDIFSRDHQQEMAIQCSACTEKLQNIFPQKCLRGVSV